MLAGCLAGCAALYDDFLESSDAWHAHRGQARADTFLPASHQALLVPPRKPECEAAAGGRRLAPEGDVNSELAERIKLEYERECYRQAELRVRRQLRALQAAVREDFEEPSERASERP
jgi:hypothetical protein